MNASNAQLIEANIDSETGKVSIYAEKEIVETVEDERTEVSLEDAREVDPESEVGGMVIVESTPKNFGRVALNRRLAVWPKESPANWVGDGSAVRALSKGILRSRALRHRPPAPCSRGCI